MENDSEYLLRSVRNGNHKPRNLDWPLTMPIDRTNRLKE